MLVLQQRRSVLHLLVSTISIVLLCHETVPINAFARTSGIHVPLHHAVVRIRESRSSIGAKQDVENDDDSVSFMDVVYGSVQNVASVTAKKVEEDVLRDGFLLDWLGNLTNAERDKDDGDQREEESISDAKDLVSDEMSNTVDDNDAVSAEYLDRVLEQARKEATSEDTGDFAGILKVLNTHIKQVKEALSKHLGDLEYENIQPASLYYYLKHEEKRKDDDWKRQAHSEFPPFDIHEEKEALVEMFAFMIMCQTAYCESQEEVELCLSEVAPNRYELIYEEDTKTPNQPAHFIVIDRGETNAEEGVVEVRLVVRGTKTLTDAITDLLCDAVDYRGFKAHSGILESGTYLASQHAPLFQKLLDSPGTEKIHLTIIGHSLGAGAASIAAFEFNQVDGIEAKSIGFGCPPLVSLELAEEARDYITNVIFDWDMVSRLSPAAMVNFLLDVMEFDWTDDARRDVQRMLSHLKKRSPGIVSDNIVTDNVVEKGMSVTDKMIEQLIRPTIKEKSSERVEQRLFVPGKCIHFYRDGEKIQGAICPNTFPAELDLHHRMLKDHSIRVGYDELFVYILNELGGK